MTEIIIALIALTVMEIVLGIDNIIFITILASRLPKAQQPLARRLGLILALAMRLVLLFTLSYVVNEMNKTPWFHLTDLGIPESLLQRLGSVDETSANAGHHLSTINAVTFRDMILFVGGAFLIWKSVLEIHKQFSEEKEPLPSHTQFASVIIQIGLLDIVFSLDSVITAVGMVPADQIWIMVAAIVISIIVMLLFAGKIGAFVASHPTIKMLALSFLILIGVVLVADAIGAHLDKGYIYFAMAFAIGVEMLNIAFRKKKAAATTKTGH